MILISAYPEGMWFSFKEFTSNVNRVLWGVFFTWIEYNSYFVPTIFLPVDFGVELMGSTMLHIATGKRWSREGRRASLFLTVLLFPRWCFRAVEHPLWAHMLVIHFSRQNNKWGSSPFSLGHLGLFWSSPDVPWGYEIPCSISKMWLQMWWRKRQVFLAHLCVFSNVVGLCGLNK